MNFDFQTATFVLLATFGAVHFISYVLMKRWNIQLDSEQKIILSVVIAFAFSFVPQELGNEIANRIKDAITVAITLNGAYQFTSGVAKKIGE